MNDDLINRQAVLDALNKHCDVVCQYSKKQRSVMCGACPLGTAFDVIEALDCVDKQIGTWVYTPTEPLGYICSVCGKGCCRFNYCPNCGCAMKGEKDG